MNAIQTHDKTNMAQHHSSILLIFTSNQADIGEQRTTTKLGFKKLPKSLKSKITVPININHTQDLDLVVQQFWDDITNAV